MMLRKNFLASCEVLTEHHATPKSSYGASCHAKKFLRSIISDKNWRNRQCSSSVQMASGVSPRDVPKDERTKTKNMYCDLAVGDRIKFNLPELDMNCTNAEVVKLTLVSVAVASRASMGCGKLMNPPPRYVLAGQFCTTVRQGRTPKAVGLHQGLAPAACPQVPDVRREVRQGSQCTTGATCPHNHCVTCLAWP